MDPRSPALHWFIHTVFCYSVLGPRGLSHGFRYPDLHLAQPTVTWVTRRTPRRRVLYLSTVPTECILNTCDNRNQGIIAATPSQGLISLPHLTASEDGCTCTCNLLLSLCTVVGSWPTSPTPGLVHINGEQRGLRKASVLPQGLGKEPKAWCSQKIPLS